MRHCGAAWLAAALALAFAVPASAVTPNGRLQIIQLDVGQGDGAVIISPLGQVVMIDDGVGGNPTPASGVKVPAQLQTLGVTHVDYHFASHYHSDHIGIFPTIFGAGGVATLDYGWDRAGSYTTSYYTNYVNTLAIGSRRRTLVKNQIITLDSLSAHPVTIKCVDLAGAGISTTDENTLSVVLKISYGEFDAVYGGDLPGATSGSYKNIETTVGPEVGPVEVYKVHHHGSATSSLTDWLNATHPKIGIISVGTGNGYGHPTSAALTRLHNAGVRTYWTETGAGVAPNPAWDKVSNNQIVVSATWQAGGVDTVRGTGFADTFTNSGTPTDLPPVVAVGAPDGGENWKAGSTHAITWTATDDVGVTSVDLAWSSNGGSTFPNSVATGLANSGSYSWTVPAVPTTSARVRVTAHDAAGHLVADSSAANFTISTWTIVASAGAGGSIAPSGSVAVVQGANQTFSFRPDPGHHVTTLTVDGSPVSPETTFTFTNVTAAHSIGATFSANTYTLVVSTVGSGTVTRIPDQADYAYGTTVRLAATAAAGWALGGWSGDASGAADTVSVVIDRNKSVTATFVDVAAPTVVVTSPVGGESWSPAELRTITWTATDNAAVDSIGIDCSFSGPAGPWVPVAHGLANTGSFPWTVASQPTDSALVRVTAYDHALNAGHATSDSLFQIADPNAGVGAGGPAVLALAPPLPNPGRMSTLLRFSLPQAGSARLEILDPSGRRIWQAEGLLPAGPHSLRWDGRATEGTLAGTGLYFVRLVTPWGDRTQRLVWLR
jgi:beta-lactamase superfamily II metal-dependent hydrolase